MQIIFTFLAAPVVDAFTDASSPIRGDVNPQSPFNNIFSLCKQANYFPAPDTAYVPFGLTKVRRPVKILHSNIADTEYFDVDEKLTESCRFTAPVESG